jgi:hypothetical protein
VEQKNETVAKFWGSGRILCASWHLVESIPVGGAVISDLLYCQPRLPCLFVSGQIGVLCGTKPDDTLDENLPRCGYGSHPSFSVGGSVSDLHFVRPVCDDPFFFSDLN